MIESDKSKNKIEIVKHYCISLFSCVLLLTTVWFGAAQAAVAAPMHSYSQQLIAANPLAGVGDKIGGEAEQALGKAQRNLGNSPGQTLDGSGKEIQGLAKQAKGNVKQGIEKTKSAADDADDKVEEGSENAIDAIKDFFGN